MWTERYLGVSPVERERER
ncbi:TraX family protein [Pseudomonas sp. XWY-1]|nr:TraX family protein [Pseudomonas sp. XWY-1]